MKRIITIFLTMILAVSLLAGCGHPSESTGEDTIIFTDSCGREVELPVDLERIAPSGIVAQMILITVAPEKLVGLGKKLDRNQLKYLPEELEKLPEFGQFYGKKPNLNLEALMNARPQVIIDMGDYKEGVEEDLDHIQEQTGIPAIFIESDLEHLEEAYMTLGDLLGKEEETGRQAEFIRQTIRLARERSERIRDVKTVYFGTGESGLDTNAAGSPQQEVIELIGAENAIIPKENSTVGGGTSVSLENLYDADPDVIILNQDGPYEELDGNEWSALRAVKSGEYYRIPEYPFNWMASPPSVNKILGIWWLGQIVYPEEYNDYSMESIAQEFYSIFWHYDLTDEEAADIINQSEFK